MVEFDTSYLHVTLLSNSRFHENRVSKSHNTLLLKAVNDITPIITKSLGRFRWYSLLGILEFYQQILIKFPSIKFYEYPPSWYIWTDMMELICAFRNFANAARSWYQSRKKISKQIFSTRSTQADCLHWANWIRDLYDNSPGYIIQYRGVLYLAHHNTNDTVFRWYQCYLIFTPLSISFLVVISL